MGDIILNLKKVRLMRLKTLFYFYRRSDFFYFRYFVFCLGLFVLKCAFECKHVTKFFFFTNYNFSLR